MGSLFHRIYQFVKYLFRGKSRYYLHSPWVYQFYKSVLLNRAENRQGTRLNQYRTALQNSGLYLHAFKNGAMQAVAVPVSQIEKQVAVRHKYGMLLYHLVATYKPATILEIGTSIGISTAYIRAANHESNITTLDANSEAQHIAKDFHTKFGFDNIRYVNGYFDDTLPAVLHSTDTLDMVYFDGNHTYEATLQYFEWCLQKHNGHSIFVFDDIYWSAEMTKAWEEIKKHPDVRLTIDVYQMGICFFMKEKLAKEDFTLWY